MSFCVHKIQISTKRPLELVDVTKEVLSFVEKTKIKNGFVNILSSHTTAGICINESCEALEKDLFKFLKDLTRHDQPYQHDKIASDGRPNAHSHLLTYMMGCQQTLPIIDNKIELGIWQKIFFVELDGPRLHREITLSILGDA